MASFFSRIFKAIGGGDAKKGMDTFTGAIKPEPKAEATSGKKRRPQPRTRSKFGGVLGTNQQANIAKKTLLGQ